MTLSCGVLFSVTEASTPIPCPVDHDDIAPLSQEKGGEKHSQFLPKSQVKVIR